MAYVYSESHIFFPRVMHRIIPGMNLVYEVEQKLVAITQEKLVKNHSAFTENITVATLPRSLSAWVICCVSASHTNQV